MISFYPGPSKIYPDISEYMQEAYNSGILSANHRSPEFIALSKETIQLMREKLNVPSNFTIFFTSSATECWEIIGQSFISEFSYHIYNGAFGRKWMDYRKKLMPNVTGHEFSVHKMLGLNTLNAPQQTGVICLTQNETSNGSKVSNRLIGKVKTRFPKSIICVDATSSMAGEELKWKNADIWYASVQKCFGLPAGMAMMICSPKAIEKALQLNHNQHYNSIAFMHEKMQNWQTTYTPNVLNIFLLNRVLQSIEPISKISRKLKLRATKTRQRLERMKLKDLVLVPRLRSDTVIAIKGEPSKIQQIKKLAKENGFLLGNGYGKWKENTFRIANFPAITDEEIESLLVFLEECVACEF
jgi:phosphoserine aminotransferase